MSAWVMGKVSVQSHYGNQQNTARSKLYSVQWVLYDLLNELGDQVCNQSHSLVHQDGDKMAIRLSQSVISLQLNRFKLAVTSVCDNMAITNVLPYAANLLFMYTEIHFNYLHSEFIQNLVDMKETFTNSDIVAAGQQSTSSMTHALGNFTFI